MALLNCYKAKLLLSCSLSQFPNIREFSVLTTPPDILSILSKGAAASVGGLAKRAGWEVENSKQKAAWIPDPRTGFYRPENIADEIDAAELRALLLKKH